MVISKHHIQSKNNSEQNKSNQIHNDDIDFDNTKHKTTTTIIKHRQTKTNKDT